MEAIFEELNLTTPFQQISFICSRQFHEQTKVQRASDCMKLMTTIHTCMCHFIDKVNSLGSNDLTFFTMMKAKENCGICQWNIHRLYHFIQELPFHQISQICDPKKLLSNPLVLNNRKIFTQIFQQFELDDTIIWEILPKMSNTILCDILARKIRNNLQLQHKLEDIFPSTTIAATSKKYNERSIDYYFHIFNLCLTTDVFIKVNYTQIMQLLELIFGVCIMVHYDTNDVNRVTNLTGNYTKIAPKSLVHFILYDINKGIRLLDDYVFDHYDANESFNIQYDSYLNECLAYFAKYDYENIEFIEFHMHSSLRFKFIEMLPIGLFIQNIANRNEGYATQKLPLYVNPQQMLYSMANYNVMKQLANPKSYTHVIYQTSNGDLGEDAGGLTRDLYTNFPKEVAQYFDKIDEYMIPKNTDVIVMNHRWWRLIGIMFARSIFYENISPSLSIHPIVVYMMIYGYQSILLDHLFDTLAPFKIDYITNLKKIQTMSHEEYCTFLSLQGEDTYICKKEYIQMQILNRYIQPPLHKFILGFRAMIPKRTSKSNISLHHLSFVNFWKYIRGIESYKINTMDRGSLSRNLNVEPDENSIQRIWIWEEDGERLKESLLWVLEEFGKTDLPTLKAFLQFWFGTDSISDFSNKKPIITIIATDIYPGCFGARTCFDELQVHKSIFKYTDKVLDNKIREYITSSLYNQSLTQSIGLNMQMM